MKRFTSGFGARRSFEVKVAAAADRPSESNKSSKSVASTTPWTPQCFPQFYSPARDSSHRRRSVDCRDGRVGDLAAATTRDQLVAAMRRRSVDGRVADVGDVAAREAVNSMSRDGQVPMRRQSVDDSRPGESMDLQVVRKELWKNSPPTHLMSPSDSFSSFSDVQSPSRPSNASAVSCTSSDTIRDTGANGIRDKNGMRAVVVGFDANAKEVGVGTTVAWAFRNVGMQKGDALVLVGVMDTIRGPLGYKVQVNDQTWLGANKRLLDAEIEAKNSAWSLRFPVLKKHCAEAGVTLVVDVKAAQRHEVAIVQEATARRAVHVVLDRSLRNKRRRYYSERLACAVTRMRRSGGVDTIRSEATTTSVPLSPTSVLTGSQQQQRPPRYSISSNLSLINPTIDEEELFCIDHDFLTRRVEMLLEPEIVLADNRRHDQLIAVDDDDGYESDDLFSLAGGDGASRRPSVVGVFAMESARNSIAGATRSSISRLTQFLSG